MTKDREQEAGQMQEGGQEGQADSVHQCHKEGSRKDRCESERQQGRRDPVQADGGAPVEEEAGEEQCF